MTKRYREFVKIRRWIGRKMAGILVSGCDDSDEDSWIDEKYDWGAKTGLAGMVNICITSTLHKRPDLGILVCASSRDVKGEVPIYEFNLERSSIIKNNGLLLE
jgi:hypothetical protein